MYCFVRTCIYICIDNFPAQRYIYLHIWGHLFYDCVVIYILILEIGKNVRYMCGKTHPHISRFIQFFGNVFYLVLIG